MKKNKKIDHNLCITLPKGVKKLKKHGQHIINLLTKGDL
jgi:hypothetical protein